MRDNIEPQAWPKYLRAFNVRNKSRPTWLQILGEAGAQYEEQGLPLMGICVEEKNGKPPSVQIMLGGDNAVERRHLTHVIDNVEQVISKVGHDGSDEAVEFIDTYGEISLLIFEQRAKMAAHA